MPPTLSAYLRCRRPIGRSIVFVAALVGIGVSAWADEMATYQSGDEAPIVLLADPCPIDTTGQLKLAYQKTPENDMLAGCWSFDAQHNPVITWRGGRVQALDAAQVRFKPKYAQIIEERRIDPTPQAEAPPQVVTAPRADAPSQVVTEPRPDAPSQVVTEPRPDVPSQVVTAPRPVMPLPAPPQANPAPSSTVPASARPVWCKDAKRAHELLICRDRELSANDLALSPYWRSYRSRMQLDRAEETRVKNDFYRRLKACGAGKECIRREQSAQMAFYRRALGYE